MSGVFGSAYKLGGSGSFGRVTGGVETFGIGGNHARTISFWFKTPSFGGSSDQFRLVGIGAGSAASFNIVAEGGKDAGDKNRVGLRYGNGNIFYDADNNGNSFAIDTWYHLAVVYDGTNLDFEAIGASSDGTGLTFYVNGAVVNTAAGNLNNGQQTLNTELSDFVLGANADGSAAFSGARSYPGLLDDVRVYDSALTAPEIATLAGAANGKPAPIIDSFTVDSESVTPGTRITLSWKVANYETLMVGWGSEGMVAPAVDGVGSITLPIKETTEFTLIASDKNGVCTSSNLRVVVD